MSVHDNTIYSSHMFFGQLHVVKADKPADWRWPTKAGATYAGSKQPIHHYLFQWLGHSQRGEAINDPRFNSNV